LAQETTKENKKTRKNVTVHTSLLALADKCKTKNKVPIQVLMLIIIIACGSTNCRKQKLRFAAQCFLCLHDINRGGLFPSSKMFGLLDDQLMTN